MSVCLLIDALEKAFAFAVIKRRNNPRVYVLMPMKRRKAITTQQWIALIQLLSNMLYRNV